MDLNFSEYLGLVKQVVRSYRKNRWLEGLRRRGMHIGERVNLPETTWIDPSHCFLISIGDNCGFGNFCRILAHDAMPNEFLDATRVGRVTIHESCHFGMATLILPGVSVGPRAILGSGSVVAHDIPADCVAAGNPAKVICSLDEFLQKHRKGLKEKPVFPYDLYSVEFLTPKRREGMMSALEQSIGYIYGGYSYDTLSLSEGRGLR